MRSRPTARIVLLDTRNRILLFNYDDPRVIASEQVSSSVFWLTPGGGLEPGESFEEAARRELWEETGIQVEQVGPWLWYRERAVPVPGEDLLFQERYFLVRTTTTEIHLRNSLPYEHELYRGHRWWPLADLQHSRDRILPPGLPALLVPVLAGDLPAAPLTIE